MQTNLVTVTEPDLRDLLLRAGVGQFNAVMSITYMNMLPTTVDPYAQGVLQIVQGLQRLLNARGANLEVDGGLGEETLHALKFFSGPRWSEKTWAQLYNEVIRGERWRGFRRTDRAILNDMDGLGASFVGDVIASPLLLIGAAALGYHLLKKRRSR